MKKFRKFLAVALIALAIIAAMIAVTLGLYALFAGDAVNATTTLANARVFILGSISFFGNWQVGSMVAFLGIVAGALATLAFAIDATAAERAVSTAFEAAVNTATAITRGVTEVAARTASEVVDVVGSSKIGGLPIWAWVAIGFGAVLLLKGQET